MTVQDEREAIWAEIRKLAADRLIASGYSLPLEVALRLALEDRPDLEREYERLGGALWWRPEFYAQASQH